MGAADAFALDAISPHIESGAYEELWTQDKQSFKKLSELFKDSLHEKPSAYVDEATALARRAEVLKILQKRGITDSGFLVYGSADYPEALRDAKYPLQCLYYRGDLNLLSAKHRVAVVGTREPTEAGVKRTRQIAKRLAQAGSVVVSGLAKGVDTAAHQAAIEAGGATIAVLGTPISEVYPKENADLQHRIATEYLAISQVPVLRYQTQGPNGNRIFFPERNVTMSAITEATIIVEAGETSGTLYQAKAAIHQGRKLFILNSCFESGLSWPAKYEALGAIRVKDFQQITDGLGLEA